ncbi:hypothetical protein MSG28_001902 [Choristoneura fumiferana]|uniref:Uncharacterized protein n=1 Tax=Choristoneura fumiferana TaxID=7141 RepID=A0ACC0JTJ5_CHOFU|nr:hypothetical protein MSG28_001902 [Choristoneura fumiferana]
MASLAHSLLALALVALLQAVSAEPRGSLVSWLSGMLKSGHRRQECTTVLFGARSGSKYELPPIYITVANSDVKIDDRRIGVEVIGEEVTVCNRRGDLKPRVTQTFPNSLDYVKVVLGFCDPPPVDMEMRVTRFVRTIF